MRRTAVRVGIIAAALVGVASIAPSAMAAPAPDKGLCKSGGYANYIDPTTHLPFQSQGQCVSFVNRGGTLATSQRITTTLGNVSTTITDSGGRIVYFTVYAAGLTPGGPITWTHEYGGGSSEVPATASAGGDFNLSLNTDCSGPDFLTFRDETTGATSERVDLLSVCSE